MICPKCGQENIEDASFCENCGTQLKTTLTTKPPSKNSLKKEGMAQSTKILIIVCIVLVIGVGIAIGVLYKNSQTPGTVVTNQNSTNVTTNPSTSTSSIPVSDVPNLAVGISNSNGNIASVSYGSTTLNKNQCLYILSKAIVMINSNQTGNIPINSYGNAANPTGTVTDGTIAKADYVDMAMRTYTWMDNNGISPNFVGITNPGQPDLTPDTTLNLFANILSQYKSTGQLPSSVPIP